MAVGHLCTGWPCVNINSTPPVELRVGKRKRRINNVNNTVGIMSGGGRKFVHIEVTEVENSACVDGRWFSASYGMLCVGVSFLRYQVSKYLQCFTHYKNMSTCT